MSRECKQANEETNSQQTIGKIFFLIKNQMQNKLIIEKH